MSSYSYLTTDNYLTVVKDGVPLTTRDPDLLIKALFAIKSDDLEKAYNLLSPNTRLEKAGFEIKNDCLYINGRRLDSYEAKVAVKHSKQGLPIQHLLAFIGRKAKNPSPDSVAQLYQFLEHGNLPIDQDGYVLAYRRVRDDYFDFYTASFLNKVGEVLEMPRESVEYNPEKTCAAGFHVCSLEYLTKGSFPDGKTMVAKVDPADFVSVPTDYNRSKARVCKLEIVAELTGDDLEAALADYTANSSTVLP